MCSELVCPGSTWKKSSGVVERAQQRGPGTGWDNMGLEKGHSSILVGVVGACHTLFKLSFSRIYISISSCNIFGLNYILLEYLVAFILFHK